MPRYLVRYHRAILGGDGRVLFPSGAILDSLDGVPPSMLSRLVLIEDEKPEEETEEEPAETD